MRRERVGEKVFKTPQWVEYKRNRKDAASARRKVKHHRRRGRASISVM